MDYYDQIEEYLNQTLSESEYIAFEKAMEADVNLKQAVEDHEAAMDVVGSILEAEVRGIINDEVLINNEQLIIDSGDGGVEANEGRKEESGRLADENDGRGSGAKVKRMNWVRWASAAVVVFVMGWWGMSLLGGDKGGLAEVITGKYYTPLPTLGTMSNAKLNSKLDSALYFYDVRDFDRSLDMFEDLNKDTQNDTISIHLAHLYFLDKKYEKSKIMLQAISDNTQLISGKAELQFYLALIENDQITANAIINAMPLEEQKRLKPLLGF